MSVNDSVDQALHHTATEPRCKSAVCPLGTFMLYSIKKTSAKRFDI